MALADVIPADPTPSVKWAPSANTVRVYDRMVYSNDTAITVAPVLRYINLPSRVAADEVTIYPKTQNAVLLDPTGEGANAGVWYADVIVNADPDMTPNDVLVELSHPNWAQPEIRLIPVGSPLKVLWTSLAAAVLPDPVQYIFVGGDFGAGQGPQGPAGPSAYQVAVNNGFVGTQSQWLASLVGSQGPTGNQGPPGNTGATGPQGSPGTPGAPGATGPQGPPGAPGATGDTGAPGTPGAQGAAGQSAYQIAVANGFVGTQTQWLASLVGPTGPAGANGTGIVLLEAGASMPGSPVPGSIYLRKLSVDVTPPTTPGVPAPSALTSSSVTMTWTGATDAVGVDHYEFQVNGVTYANVAGLSVNVTGLSPSTAYVMRVRAVDAAGNASPWATANVTTSASADTVAPTTPTGVTISSQTSTGFVVSWTPSTDNVGVTGYEVQIDGVAESGVSSNTTKTITGKTASTTYSVRVRARDAAGNWSGLSTAVNAVTTTSGGGTYSAQHSIWGTSPHPAVASWTLGVDGTPDIELGHGFYRYGSGTGFYPNMRVIGMKIWRPTGMALPANLGIKCYTGPGTGTGGNLGTQRLSKNFTGYTWVDGWNSFYFDTQYSLVGAESILMMYRFTDTADQAKYMYSSNDAFLAPDFIANADGTKLALSETGSMVSGYFRQKWRIGATFGVPTLGNTSYGVDIICDEGAP